MFDLRRWSRRYPRVAGDRLFCALMTTIVLAGVAGSAPALAATGKWTTNGPYGGNVKELVIDPVSAGTTYVAGYGGVFKSTNGGALWAPSNSGFLYAAAPYLFVSALAMSPADHNTLYAAEINGVYKTTDGGARWSQAGVALIGSRATALAIDPLAANKIYVYANDRIYRSKDGGSTWVGSGAGLSTVSVNSLVVATVKSASAAAPAPIYAATSRGIFKSIDDGVTWVASNSGITNNLYSFHVAVDPVTPATLYAATARALYKSLDSGTNWTKSDSGISNDKFQYTPYKIALDPQTPATVYLGTAEGGVFRSTNGGTSWVAATTGLGALPVGALAVDSHVAGTLLAGTDTRGVFRTQDNGTSWVESNTGYANIKVTVVALDPRTPTTIYAGTRSGGLYKSSDGGGSWAVSSNGLDDWVTSLAIDPVTPTTIYAGTHQFVFKSVDRGATWTPSITGATGLLVPAIAVDPTNPQIVVAGTLNGGIYRSTNAGTTWTAVSAGLPPGASIYGLSFSSTVPRSLWAAVHSRDGLDSFMNSPDSGATWSSTYPGFDTSKGWVFALNFLHNGAGVKSLTLGYDAAFLPLYPPPYPTTVGVSIGDCLPLTSFLTDPNAPSDGYVGGGCGVLKATNDGAVLTAMNTGYPDAPAVSSLVVTPAGNTLYAGFDGGSVYQFSNTRALAVVTEFYNTPLDNYFITSDPIEVAAIESGGAGPGWARTGNSFNFNSGGDTSVCRFYGSLNPGPNSHFYTVSAAECNGLKAAQATTPASVPRWNFESLDFISTVPVSGACPDGTVPVYRAYNNGFNRKVDSNHRITGNAAGIAAVVARGWVSEGIVMCAPR